MNIEDLTIKQARELACLFGGQAKTVNVGCGISGNVFIRTLTYHYTGEIVEDTEEYLKLNTAAWVADSGRFADALNSGTLKEVEPMGDGVIIMKNNIVDIIPWGNNLPVSQK